MEENNVNEVYHHGIIGQKWGIRRYQNKDGSLTAAGKKRADKLKQKYTELTGKRMRRNPTKTKESKKEETKKEESKKEVKSYKDLTNEELTRLTNRMNLEKNYLDSMKNLERATPQQISRGKRFMKSLSDDVAKPAFKEAGKDLLTRWLKKVGSDYLDLNPKETQKAKDTLSELKKESDTLLNQKLIKQYRHEIDLMDKGIYPNQNQNQNQNQNSNTKPKSESKPKTETKPKSNTKPRPEIEGQMYIDDLFKRKKK